MNKQIKVTEVKSSKWPIIEVFECGVWRRLHIKSKEYSEALAKHKK